MLRGIVLTGALGSQTTSLAIQSPKVSSAYLDVAGLAVDVEYVIVYPR